MIPGIILQLLLEISIVIVIALFLTYAGFIIIRKKFSHEFLSEYHTVASYMFNSISITYGVLLAFVVYLNWFNYEKSEQNIENETAYLSNFYRDTRTLPDSIRNAITNKLINYTKSVIDDEWITMSKGKTSPHTEAALDSLWKSFTSIPANSITNIYFYQFAIERLNFISQCRRQRILDMEQTTPAVIWTVLIICGSISVGYTYFFSTKKRRAHLSLIATIIIVNVLIFYLIYVLDHPFEGYTGISQEPFKLVLDKFYNLK